ncbi:hypothetical protein HanPI659440_Chr14g0560061 [Helianthus annuus]|nr:hypothetical protein HanPI659440_Chr14g0560061 [Helianthus annuus]
MIIVTYNMSSSPPGIFLAVLYNYELLINIIIHIRLLLIMPFLVIAFLYLVIRLSLSLICVCVCLALASIRTSPLLNPLWLFMYCPTCGCHHIIYIIIYI